MYGTIERRNGCELGVTRANGRYYWTVTSCSGGTLYFEAVEDAIACFDTLSN